MKKNIELLKLISIITVLSLTGCGNNKDINVTNKFINTLDEYSKETCFDELLGKDMIEEITNLEQYLQISEYLNKSKIHKINFQIEDIEQYRSQLLLPKDIISKIKEQTMTNEELKLQAILINDYIKSKGYNLITKILCTEFQSILGNGFNLSLEEIEKIKVPNQEFVGDTQVVFPVVIDGEKYSLDKNNELKGLINQIDITIDNSHGHSYINGAGYNRERNKVIKEGLNLARRLITLKVESTSKNYIKTRKK